MTHTASVFSGGWGRRTACGASALLGFMGVILGIAAVIAGIALIVVVLGATHLWGTLVALLLGLLAFWAGATLRKRRQESNESNTISVDPPAVGKEIAKALSVRGLKMLSVLTLLATEGYSLLVFGQAFLTSLPHGKETPDLLGQIIDVLFLQAVATFIGWVIWQGVDKRWFPGKFTRAWSLFFLLLLPSWGMYLAGGTTPAALLHGLIAGLSGLLLMGAILGFTFSCERNLFEIIASKSAQRHGGEV